MAWSCSVGSWLGSTSTTSWQPLPAASARASLTISNQRFMIRSRAWLLGTLTVSWRSSTLIGRTSLNVDIQTASVTWVRRWSATRIHT